MKSAIIGIGSIGERHLRVLKNLGHELAVVTKRKDISLPKYKNIAELLQNFSPDYIVICNETHKHFSQLIELERLGYKNKVLVEKPIFNELKTNFTFSFKVCVGYNLRFHPYLQKIFKILKENRRVFSANVYVGQNLSLWRKRDYRNCYSSKKEFGGGVLRDLSHEIDYLLWLFGWPTSLVSYVDKVGSLDINTEDNVNILWISKKCPCINLSMNYLDNIGKREIIIHTDKETIFCDLVNGILQINSESEKLTIDKDFTYKKMHRSYISEEKECASLENGIKTLKVVEQIEKSAIKKSWVSHDYESEATETYDENNIKVNNQNNL